MIGCEPGQCGMENGMLPMLHGPPLHVIDGSKGTARPLQFGTSAVTRAARTKLKSTTDCLRGPDCPSRFTPEPFSKTGCGRKAAEV